jgi:hypothetical protein
MCRQDDKLSSKRLISTVTANELPHWHWKIKTVDDGGCFVPPKSSG